MFKFELEYKSEFYDGDRAPSSYGKGMLRFIAYEKESSNSIKHCDGDTDDPTFKIDQDLGVFFAYLLVWFNITTVSKHKKSFPVFKSNE